ncbi:MAG: hypothetical protein PHP62_02840 [Candidatus Moranbacteria bacterium]|nr:hypothetical protein [Candidatus Moranbacteria bacterium]
MKTKKYFLKRVAVFVFLLVGFFSLSKNVSAVEPVAVPEQEGLQIVTVATVDVQDATIKWQKGNEFRILFNLSNKAGIQPAIIYAINLMRTDSDGKMIQIDQRVYDDVISLGENDSSLQAINYSAPKYLSGKFQLMIEARNPDGLMLGITPAGGEVTLAGNGEYLDVDPVRCYLNVNNERFEIWQGVDVSKEEVLVMHCEIESKFKSIQTITPVFSTRFRSSFGKLLEVRKEDKVTLEVEKKQNFSVNIPKITEPQAYEAILTFENEKEEQISTPINFHYVVQGESATIQNILLDKDQYLKGENASISFFWSGSASSFPGSRSEKRFSASDVWVTIDIKSNNKEICSEQLKKQLDVSMVNPKEEIIIPITADCLNPRVAVQISDAQGKNLASNIYEIESKNTPNAALEVNKKENNNTKYFIIAAFLIFVFPLIIIFLIKRKNNAVLSTLFFVAVGIGALFSNSDARALTWGDSNGVTFVMNFDKSIYSPGQSISLTGNVFYPNCTNAGTDAQLIANDIGDAYNTASFFWGRAGGGSSAAITKTYSGYAKAGSYKTHFIGGSRLAGASSVVYTDQWPYIQVAENPTCSMTISNPSNYGWPINTGVAIDASLPYNISDMSWTCAVPGATVVGNYADFDPFGYVVSVKNGDVINCTGTVKNAAGVTGTCSVSKTISVAAPADGVCGTADGGTFSSLLSTNPTLCDTGTVKSFNALPSTWNWLCAGSSGGLDSIRCSAIKSGVTPIIGECGTADGETYPSLSSNSSLLCNSGDVTLFTENISSWSWFCQSPTGSGNSFPCNAYKGAASTYCGDGNCDSNETSATCASDCPIANPRPSFTLTGSIIDLENGALPRSTTLTWSAVSNATSCTKSPNLGSGAAALTGGNAAVIQAQPSVTYSITCIGPGGSTTKSATVQTRCTNTTCISGNTICDTTYRYNVATTSSCSKLCTTNASCSAALPTTPTTTNGSQIPWREVAP